jgi:hypothetical protein
MTEPRVTNGAGTPETVTIEHVVTPPKRDRAEYMREYRARQNNKSNNQGLNVSENHETLSNPEIIPAPELNSTPPEAEQKTETSAPASKPDEAGLALQRQIAELKRSEQLLARQKQQQAEQEAAIVQLRQVYDYWKQSGLSESEGKFLLAYPAVFPS